MTAETAFSARHEYGVHVSHAELGDIGRGTLFFGEKGLTYLSFGMLSFSGKLEDGIRYPRLIARTESGEAFTLFGCEANGLRVHIDYVVDGVVEDAFQAIRIRFTEVSDWFFVGQYLSGEVGASLTWERRPQPIEVKVQADGSALSITTAIVSSRERSGEDLVINEHVCFVVEKDGGFFDVQESRERCRELSILMTLLIAQPVDINSVGLVGDNGGLHHVYFPYYEKRVETNSRSWPRFLIQKASIQGRWQTIFENFYRSDFRSVAWARMAGMLRYDSFWEYKVLGYVSLLDGVVKKKAESQKKEMVAPAERHLVMLEEKMRKMSAPLSGEQRDQVVGMVRDVFTRAKKSFAECFNYAISTSDNNVMSVINLSSEDLTLIKDFRNDIAHGDEMHTPPTRHGRVSRVENKVVLLLTYWALTELGLTAGDFLWALARSHNPAVLGADIDEVRMERVLGTAAFYKVPKQRFDEISAMSSKSQLCFARDGLGEISYSQVYTLMFDEWVKKSGGGIIDPKEVFGIEPTRVKCFSKAYMECGDERLALFHVYVLEDALLGVV
ncbi:MAG: hypothetical protein WBW32_01400 [Luteibacter sp.]